MPVIVPDVAELVLLEALRAYLNGATPIIHLFSNDITPDADTVLADFTEVDFDGYAPQVLEEFAAAAPDGNGRAVIAAAPNVFTKAAGTTTDLAYGYYITDASSTVLLWCDRDPNGPRPFVSVGAEYTITPKLSLRSEV